MPKKPQEDPSPPHRARRRRVVALGLSIAGVLLLAVFEVGGYVFLSEQRDRCVLWFEFDIDEYVDSLDPTTLEHFVKAREFGHSYGPHHTCGWTRNAGTTLRRGNNTTTTTDSIGSRIVPGASGPNWLSTYGDSFTEGVEVDDADTYQAEFSRLAGVRVLNFGVAGYGPTQALLALEDNLAKGYQTPVVMLAVIHENLGRLLNTFRMIYTYPHEDMTLGFKPVLIPRGDGFELFSAFPTDWSDRDSIRAAIHASAVHDPYYAARTTKFSSPYSLHAALFVCKHGLQPDPVWSDLLKPEIARMGEVLRRFHALSNKHGFIPVFVLLPESPSHIQGRAKQGVGLFGRLVAKLALDGLIFIDVPIELDRRGAGALVQDFDPTRYLVKTHPSAHGNAAIGKVLFRRLVQLGVGADLSSGASESK